MFNIPEKFTIAGNEIKVIIEDKVRDNNYGYFCDVTNEIHIAKKLDCKYSDEVELTELQKMNTFFHEYYHACQFYYNNSYDEAQAQVYANFMCELINSTDKPF